MELNELTAISPVDGRYRGKTRELASYFSEYSLIKYRILVEIEYFIKLCEWPLPELSEFNKKLFPQLRNIYTDFSVKDAQHVKEIEKTTNHDVKSVEYFIKEKFNQLGLEPFKEFIHFGLTSQDINNTAIPLSLKDAIETIYKPQVFNLVKSLESKTSEWLDIPMLARTHGQPASPTSLGKEIKVFTDRLNNQLKYLLQVPYPAKFGGATGNFNAHHVAYPDIDWIAFGNSLVNDQLGLKRSATTTQIDHYDNLAALFDTLKRINTILIDMCRDMWTYISMDYFSQKVMKDEVGSSAMPHKVNPIDYENAEGNLGVANALLNHLSEKLPVSRLQRDLTDSTVLRNIGVPIAHTSLALQSLNKGLSRISVNEIKIREDLDKNWSVIAEAVQTILRREGYPNPYEALKTLTRTGSTINKELFIQFIDQLDVNEKVKNELRQITPFNYTGILPE